MLFVKQYVKGGFEINEPNLEKKLKHVERCTRVCYQSEHKITDDSYKELLENIKKRGHLSVFRHAIIHLAMRYGEHYMYDNYSYAIKKDGIYYVSTNMQVIIENGWENDLQYMVEPTENHLPYKCLYIQTSLGVLNDIIRHTTLYPTVESSRYVDYTKGVSFILNEYMVGKGVIDIESMSKYIKDNPIDYQALNFYRSCKESESDYIDCRQHGGSPQEASLRLTKNACVHMWMTGFEPAWKHFLDLRVNKGCRPEVFALAQMCKTQLGNVRSFEELGFHKCQPKSVKERLISEIDDLTDKIINANCALDKDIVPVEHKQLLFQQLEHMNAYKHILEERLKLM